VEFIESARFDWDNPALAATNVVMRTLVASLEEYALKAIRRNRLHAKNVPEPQRSAGPRPRIQFAAFLASS
jgi:hypothetical protein